MDSLSSWTFTAEIRNLNNYYPYGMELPGGAFASIGNYGYGYNGMEKDDELKGEGKVMNYGARLYNTQGTFLSLDPKMSKYPMLSPYIFGNNNPIKYLDFDGREFKEGNTNFWNEFSYDAVIKKLNDNNPYIYTWGANLYYDKTTNELIVIEPDLNKVIDPNSSKYENKIKVIFTISTRQLDNQLRKDEENLKSGTFLNGLTTMPTNSSSITVSKSNILTYSAFQGSKELDLNNTSVDEATEIIFNEWNSMQKKIGESFYHINLRTDKDDDNNEVVNILIEFDDFLNDELNADSDPNNDISQLDLVIEKLKHELGHVNGSFETFKKLIKSMIYQKIDNNREPKDRTKGHDPGNPSGERAIEWEKK